MTAKRETKDEYERRTGASITDQQWRAWENDLRGASLGNPYATMCRHCSVRHGPPRDGDCQRQSGKDTAGGAAS